MLIDTIQKPLCGYLFVLLKNNITKTLISRRFKPEAAFNTEEV